MPPEQALPVVADRIHRLLDDAGIARDRALGAGLATYGPQDRQARLVQQGGLYGENHGWSLPGFPDANWQISTLPATQPAGVTWYRTNVELDLRADQDTSVGLRITGDPARRFRATIFVNGWNVGQYINHRGPQNTFVVPNGILKPRGDNSIAIAVWNESASASRSTCDPRRQVSSRGPQRADAGGITSPGLGGSSGLTLGRTYSRAVGDIVGWP
ncbi:beta galactosidase jelly roll domain-containing protein [Micromonospora sp. KC723]|uniref:beta galactosidase jelly roll domain-containing protein n=1 Tax=Micromonospora sp. KC723 TaxID=2530381 RepID=UPI00104AEDAE|nr:beta galactosidase jelly roll domain-containing protein [Micromonospora sp. KC723]TDB78351.1 hypothetical protein E1165_01470 [Micromonospora sp. KC723]